MKRYYLRVMVCVPGPDGEWVKYSDALAAIEQRDRRIAELEAGEQELRMASYNIMQRDAARIAELEAERDRLERNCFEWREAHDTLRAEVDALKADAERYRWWRAFVFDENADFNLLAKCETGEELDATIDTERGK